MNALEVRGLLQELMDENPFAIRALLRIVRVEFTTEVPTAAVTAEEHPRLRLNLEFIAAHCRTPEHVKALLCHEFLHVLLRHTSTTGPLMPARHVALDAVINAIVHRQFGEAYSSMMSAYYRRARGIVRMLRPMTRQEEGRYISASCGSGAVPTWWHVWRGLYRGEVLADDIEQVAEEFAGQARAAKAGAVQTSTFPGMDRLLGNHADDDPPLSETLERALEQAQRELNGGGIWRTAGRGGNAYATLVNPQRAALERWKRTTLAVLRKHVVPDRGAPKSAVTASAQLPVLSVSDRRAFLRATWSPFLPEATWPATVQRPEGRAHVYLDVSGSMNAEMPLVVALLGQLYGWIKRPLWAFSTHVAPAVIERGVLRADTTGGTSLACVLEHVERTRPACALIVTDGYVEAIGRPKLATLRARTKLHAIVTRDGNPASLARAGLPYSQLERLPS
jgi:hypothetical protein